VLGLLFVIAACAPVHRVVKVPGGKTQTGANLTYYGVTYNNTLIPEYTKSGKGIYAGSSEEAWSLFKSNSPETDKWIADKYWLSNAPWYYFSTSVVRAGQLIGAPFAIPGAWIGEKFFPDKTLGPRRSVKEITREYFMLPYDEPTEKPLGLQKYQQRT
jgi:hypothetical protein